MAVLLPRLSGPAADRALDEFFANGPADWAGFDARNLPNEVRFSATGGSRASPDTLNKLREALLTIAQKNGFGGASSRRGFATFDANASALLGQTPLLSSGEALRDDVWSFISVSLAPDIVFWRFGKARERYLGGVRNTFQRLWMRARALDCGGDVPKERWHLLLKLTEDALVQITERPSIGGNPMLARELAEAWVRAGERHGKSKLEPLMRRVTLRVRMLNEIRDMTILVHSELAELLDQLFDDSAESLLAEK